MHALRHSCASTWLERGVSIKAVSEYLGHADPGFTLRVYTMSCRRPLRRRAKQWTRRSERAGGPPKPRPLLAHVWRTRARQAVETDGRR